MQHVELSFAPFLGKPDLPFSSTEEQTIITVVATLNKQLHCFLPLHEAFEAVEFNGCGIF